jgi:hypothetical protein
MMDRRLGALVGLGVALGLLVFQIGEVTISDGVDMLAVARSIIHHASLVVPAQYGVLGRGGHYYAKYGIGLSLVALPFVVVGDVLAVPLGHQAQLESFGAATAMPIITGIVTTVLWHVSRKLGASARWATLIAVGTIVGTFALPYGKNFFSEPLAALGIAVALERLLASRYRGAGLGLALAIITRPEAAVLMLLLPLIVWRFRGVSSAVAFAATAAMGAVIDALYNFLRFGNGLTSGYGSVGFTTPFFHGAAGLLFGTNKSLFIFAPIAILFLPLAVRLWREHQLYVACAAVTFAVFFVLNSLWDRWQGGWAWGPRLVLPGVISAMPLLAGARSRVERRLAMFLLAVGFVVSASTLLVPMEAQQLDRPLPVNGPSPITQYRLIPSAVGYSTQHLGTTHAPGTSRRHLSLWQINLGRELGNEGLLIGLIGSLALLAALAVTVKRTSELLRRNGFEFGGHRLISGK